MDPASVVPEPAVEPPVGGEGCCVASEEGADWVGAAVAGLGAGGFGTGGLGAADVVASSKAANGCEAASWLDEDACIRDSEVSETTAGESGAILDILDTWGPLETP
ncbi:MAG: hypothetical protein WBG15_17075 [Xanthobacteraceae bacterium]